MWGNQVSTTPSPTLNTRIFATRCIQSYSLEAIWVQEPNKCLDTIHVLTIKNNVQNYFPNFEKKYRNYDLRTLKIRAIVKKTTRRRNIS